MARGMLVACTAAVALVPACGGGDGETEGPVVQLLDEAIAAVEAHYGAPQDYFEVSADADRVSVIVAVDGAAAAEQAYYRDGALVGPEAVGPASGYTFRADAIDVDPDRVFDRLRDELGDPNIVDFAVQGGPDGAVIYDATVLSEQGGRLLVLLGPTGQILATQAE